MKNTNTAISIFIGAVTAPACGQWVDLPQPEEVLEEIIEAVKLESGCEEIMISDTDGAYNIGEFYNIFDLNETAEELEALDEYEREAVAAIVENHGDSISEAIGRVNDGEYRIYCNCYTMADVARDICDECGTLDRVPDDLKDYFDFEAYGRDLEINGYFYYIGGGEYLEIW